MFKEMIYGGSIEIIHAATYKGFNYYILNYSTHPAAYVEIPKGHKLYGKDYKDIDIYVHGNLTYSRDHLLTIRNNTWFIGWDYAHRGDFFQGGSFNIEGKHYTTKEIIKDCKKVINQITKGVGIYVN